MSLDDPNSRFAFTGGRRSALRLEHRIARRPAPRQPMKWAQPLRRHVHRGRRGPGSVHGGSASPASPRRPIPPRYGDAQVSRAPHGSAVSGGHGDQRMTARSAVEGLLKPLQPAPSSFSSSIDSRPPPAARGDGAGCSSRARAREHARARWAVHFVHLPAWPQGALHGSREIQPVREGRSEADGNRELQGPLPWRIGNGTRSAEKASA
jgi:hypothetical protein